MELALKVLRKGSNQLLLEPLQDAKTSPGNAKRDQWLQPTATAGRGSQGHEEEREGPSLFSPASLL